MNKKNKVEKEFDTVKFFRKVKEKIAKRNSRNDFFGIKGIYQ